MDLGLKLQPRIPPIAVSAQLLVSDAAVLVWGELPALAESTLLARGVEIVRVSTYRGAIEALSAQPFHSVAVDPTIDGGLDLVKRLKLAPEGDLLESEWTAASRHLAVPFVVLPMDGDEYAVIVAPPEGAFLESARRVPIARALLDLDVRHLLPRERRS